MRTLICLLLVAGATRESSAQRLTPVQLYEAKTRSVAMMQRGRMDSALVLLRTIAPLDSADVAVWRDYGRVAAQQKRWQEAARALEHAYDLGAFNRGMTALQIARAYIDDGQPKTALDWIERAVHDRLAYPSRFVDDSAFASLRDSARLRSLYPRSDSAVITRDERWRRDIDFFRREAQRMHVHAERPAYSEAFADTLDALKARVPTSSDMSIKLGLRRAVAMLRDGHSGMSRDTAMRMLPIDLYVFSDGVYVVNGVGEATKHTGSKVIGIGKSTIDDVSRAVAAFVTHDNDMNLRSKLPAALVNTAFLAEIGAASSDGTTDVTLEDHRGRRTVVRLAGGPLRTPAGLSAPTAGVRPFYLERRRPFWTRELPEARALYLNFNAIAETDSLKLATFSRGLAGQLRSRAYENLIVDVRLNGGGDTFLLPPLIQAMASFAAADTSRRIFLITSRHTFSAAQNFVAKVEWLLRPIVVGEPTGSSPNFTGEVTGTSLPYSGLTITISNRLHMNSDWEDKRSWIAPHVPVPLRSADFFAGRDAALDAIVAITKQRP